MPRISCGLPVAFGGSSSLSRGSIRSRKSSGASQIVGIRFFFGIARPLSVPGSEHYTSLLDFEIVPWRYNDGFVQ
jgi:hypothetical protein